MTRKAGQRYRQTIQKHLAFAIRQRNKNRFVYYHWSKQNAKAKKKVHSGCSRAEKKGKQWKDCDLIFYITEKIVIYPIINGLSVFYYSGIPSRAHVSLQSDIKRSLENTWVFLQDWSIKDDRKGVYFQKDVGECVFTSEITHDTSTIPAKIKGWLNITTTWWIVGPTSSYRQLFAGIQIYLSHPARSIKQPSPGP